MDKISFKLISNNEISIDTEVNYKIKNDIINFVIDKVIYTLDLLNKTLSKKDSDSLLLIDTNNKIIEITLLKEGMSFDLNIDNVTYINKEKEIEIKYTIKDEESIKNEIYIKY